MKKIFSLLLVLVMCISLVACGDSTSKQNIGDTVSTDIAELTVKKASLAHYSQAASTSVSTGKTTNISTAYEPTDETNAFFKCNKGYTLVCLDFVLKNLDRDDIENYVVSYSVKQNGNTSSVQGYDLNSKAGSGNLNLSYASIAYDGSDEFFTNRTSNAIIDPNETVEIKTLGVIDFEANLEEPFELIVNLKNSKGKIEKFIYTVE